MKKSMKTSTIYMYLFILYTDEFDDKYVSVKTYWKFLMRSIEFPRAVAIWTFLLI